MEGRERGNREYFINQNEREPEEAKINWIYEQNNSMNEVYQYMMNGDKQEIQLPNWRQIKKRGEPRDDQQYVIAECETHNKELCM